MYQRKKNKPVKKTNKTKAILFDILGSFCCFIILGLIFHPMFDKKIDIYTIYFFIGCSIQLAWLKFKKK